MPKQLRLHILLILDEHDRTGSAEFFPDERLAEQTGAKLVDIQRQLDILEHDGMIQLAKSFGPFYEARIEPDGVRLVEEAREAAAEQQQEKEKPPLGFS